MCINVKNLITLITAVNLKCCLVKGKFGLLSVAINLSGYNRYISIKWKMALLQASLLISPFIITSAISAAIESASSYWNSISGDSSSLRINNQFYQSVG